MAHEHVVGLGPTGRGEAAKRQFLRLLGLMSISEGNGQNMAGNLTSYSVESEYSFTDLLLFPVLLPLTVTSRTVTVRT